MVKLQKNILDTHAHDKQHLEMKKSNLSQQNMFKLSGFKSFVLVEKISEEHAPSIIIEILIPWYKFKNIAWVLSKFWIFPWVQNFWVMHVKALN